MNEALACLICIVIGYFLGSINPAYIIGRIKRYAPRREGSGNVGAANTFIMSGKAAGAVVALVDILKTVLAWRIGERLFPGMALAGILSAVAAAFGHLMNLRRIREGKELRLSYLLRPDRELKRIGRQ